MASGTLRLIELALLVISGLALVAAYVGIQSPLLWHYLAVTLSVSLVTVLALEFADAYQTATLMRPVRYFGKLLMVWSGCFALLALAGFFLKVSADYSRFWFGAWYLTGFVLLFGLRLAMALEDRYSVRVIEHNKRRCELLAARLGEALVLNGDTTDEELLEEENIAEMDLFVAVTNDDENNIMSSLLAKRMGARRVVALINRRSYVDLLQSGQIDIAISPAQATIGTLLAHVRRGDVVAVHSLRRGAAEALEAVVHGDRESCRLTDRRVDELDLPPGTTIGAVVRGDEVIMAHHDTVIRAEDHVIVFVADKKNLPRVERMFQVGVRFM